MAAITVGSAAVVGNGQAVPATLLDDTPASGAGIITSVQYWDTQTFGETWEVGIFRHVDATHFSTVATGSLGVPAGTGLQTVTGLSLACQAGDLIGVYFATGKIAYTNSGGNGRWTANGDNIPCVNVAFAEAATYKLSLYGTGTTIPTVTSITQNHGSVGDSAVIAGTGFDAAQAPSGAVTINGVAQTVTAWGDNSITITIAGGTTTGTVVVTNSTGGVSTDVVNWTLDETPVITSLTDDHGHAGDTVVIAGTDFGAVQGTGTVTFNGVPATVTAWGDTQITVTVPAGATTGDVVVTTDAGVDSAGMTWTLDPAMASGSTPSLGTVGPALGTGAILGWPSVRA